MDKDSEAFECIAGHVFRLFYSVYYEDTGETHRLIEPDKIPDSLALKCPVCQNSVNVIPDPEFG